ncbi:MAG: hypothetical protein KatS3mg114_0615 [Planctomycetaceae bacterium]|nr:MAG: hypothetical protein KatS3mg114_0615 [Planctomycetaceae bacterium]
MIVTYIYAVLLPFITGDHWPAFLGQGASPIPEEKVPLVWSPQSGIAWKTALLGKGQSSPVIWNDRVYVTSIEGTMKERCLVTALELQTGNVVWRREFPASQPVRSNYFQSRAAPTPVVDAQAVYAFFETGELVAIAHEGQVLWKRSLVADYGPFESNIGLAASPAYHAGTLFVLIDHEGPSYLLAVNSADGSTLWKTARESRVSYSSPMLVPVGEAVHVVCSSAGSLDGYDPASGTLLWTYDRQVGGNRSASPVACGPGRFVVAASPGMHNENEDEARQTNGIVQVVPTSHGYDIQFVWRTHEAMPSFNSPLVHQGYAYWVNRAGVLFCFDAETGKKCYAHRLAQSCWATPVGIGERIYVFGKDGVTSVVKAGPDFALLAENTLWDPEEAGQEWLARRRATGESPERPRAPMPQEQTTSAPTVGSAPEGQRGGGGSDAPETRTRADRRGLGRTLSIEEQRLREQGDNRFADPVQYGVAIVPGWLIIRTGEMVYAVHQP